MTQNAFSGDDYAFLITKPSFIPDNFTLLLQFPNAHPAYWTPPKLPNLQQRSLSKAYPNITSKFVFNWCFHRKVAFKAGVNILSLSHHSNGSFQLSLHICFGYKIQEPFLTAYGCYHQELFHLMCICCMLMFLFTACTRQACFLCLMQVTTGKLTINRRYCHFSETSPQFPHFSWKITQIREFRCIGRHTYCEMQPLSRRWEERSSSLTAAVRWGCQLSTCLSSAGSTLHTDRPGR